MKRNIPKDSEKSESHQITYKLLKINEYPNDFAFKNDVTIYSNYNFDWFKNLNNLNYFKPLGNIKTKDQYVEFLSKIK